MFNYVQLYSPQSRIKTTPERKKEWKCMEFARLMLEGVGTKVSLLLFKESTVENCLHKNTL